MAKIIIAKCKACGKDFKKYDSRRISRRLAVGIRACRTVTCSKKCSDYYNYVIKRGKNKKTTKFKNSVCIISGMERQAGKTKPFDLRKIRVNGKDYTITIMHNDLIKRELSKLPKEIKKDLQIISKSAEWYCAYVYLDKRVKMPLDWETYKNGNVHGIDTNHIHNENMDLKEKEKDAIWQIKLLIRSYLKLVGNSK